MNYGFMEVSLACSDCDEMEAYFKRLLDAKTKQYGASVSSFMNARGSRTLWNGNESAGPKCRLPFNPTRYPNAFR